MSAPAPTYEWGFNEGSGSTATDSVAGLTLVPSGTPTWGTGTIKSEFYFNGTTRAYNGPSTAAVNFRLDTTVSGYQTLLRFAKNSGGQMWVHCQDGTPDIYLATQHNASATITADSDHLVVVTASAGTWKLYLDGTEVLSFTDTVQNFRLSNSDFAVAPGPAPNVVTDRLRIWEQALSSTDVADLSGGGGPTNTGGMFFA